MAVAVRPNQQAARPQMSFRRGTRQHFDKVGEISYVSGRQGDPLRFNQVGFLNGVLVRVTGTMTLSADGALTADAPWNLISRIRLVLNTGVEIITTTGFGAYLFNLLLREEFTPSGSGSARVYAAPALSGANTWAFMLWLPVASNDGQNFEVGLINLQTEQLVAQIVIDWATELTAVSLATGFVGRADVFALWYEVPDPREAAFPPLNLIHRIVEDRRVISGTGDTVYSILRQGTLMRLIHTVRLNGARNSADVTALRFELNRSDRVYRYELAPLEWHQFFRYGFDLPTGVFPWDFWFSQLDVSQGDGRDFLDTQAVAQMDSVVEVATGATLGTNNNFLDAIRQFTQILVP